MQVYDASLKLLLQSAERTFLELAGFRVSRWLDVELPKTESRRADLLGEALDGSLLHIELQSSNDAAMALRMAEYCLGVYRKLGRFPRQIVLYVGAEPMRMPAELVGGGIRFNYETIDAHDLDGELLIRSEQIGDNVLAILARVRDQGEAIRTIVRRLEALSGSARNEAIAQLLTLAGLRGLEQRVTEELKKMPLTIDLTQNKVFAAEFDRVRKEAEHSGEIKARSKVSSEVR